MISVKKRQTYLKELGLYHDKIDGIWGKNSKAATLALQKKYFTRKSDIDGIYGKNTDILLQCVYNLRNIKYFKLSEFKCDCRGKYCTGYPVVIDRQLIVNLDKMRGYFGKPITVTSGVRCQRYNDSLRGSIKNSKHTKGKAADSVVSGYTSLAARKKVMTYWKTLPKYSYTYCNVNGSYPNMGNAVHVDIK